MPQSNFIKDAVIKSYIKDILKLRSSEEAINQINSKSNSLIETILTEAKEIAIKNKRNTIMIEDINQAFEKHVGKAHLTWQEIAEEIILQNPTDLGNISKVINDYIEKNKKLSKKQKRR